MKTRSTLPTPGALLRSVGIAAALACAGGTAIASDATLKITSFTASVADFSGNFVYALDAFKYQSFNMTALNGGGVYGQQTDTYSAANLDAGLNRVATTSNASATGNLVQFTDASTQLTTAGFNLAAQASAFSYGPTAQPNYANASGLQSGAFTLYGDDGAPIAGQITFDVYYDMSVSGGAPSYGQTLLNLKLDAGNGRTASFDDGLLSTALVGGTGSLTSGHFTWTTTLAAGETARYTLAGSAIAVGAIPEPETYALMGLGLAGMAVWARRRRSIER